MAIIAKTPIDVMLGEMAYGVSDETRYADLQAIASVISNRSIALGVTPQQVVGKTSEFNAFGKALPPGASAFRDLAEAAWTDIQENGPTHPGTFYATPAAVGGLPSGLRAVAEVSGGHRYFEDPHERAIKTSLGYRAPTELATARAAFAQRQEYEERVLEDKAMPVPEERPQITQISQNPALLAGQPLEQVDPNIAFGVADTARMLAEPDMALAQNLQAPNAIDPKALAAAASRFGAEPAPMIANPADLAAAVSRMNVPASNPIDISRVMDEAIASSVDASAASKSGRLPGAAQTMGDPARMAVNSPMSAADRALQGMMKEAADSRVIDRFAPHAAPARAFENIATSGIEPGFSETIAATGVPARSVQTQSITPGQMIDSPAALASALSLGSFPGAMEAQKSVSAAKGDRVMGDVQQTADPARLGPAPANEALQAAVDGAVRGPTPSGLSMADNALQSAVDSAVRGPTPSSFSMTDNPMQAAIDNAAKSPAPSVAGLGVNSPEHAALQAIVEKNLAAVQPASDAANANGVPMTFERDIAPMPQVAKTPTVDSWSAMASAMPISAVASAAEKTGRLPATEEATVTDFGAEVQAGLPAERDQYDRLRAASAKNPANYSDLTPAVMQDAMVATGNIPTPTSNPLTAAPAIQPATIAAEEPAPALETIEPAPQPTIAAPVEAVTPAVTPTVPSVAKTMPAVQQRQSTAMDVWGGKAQTGVATDGSTVSRLSDSRIGRYVPEFNYTVFSQDDGATWSSPVKGNMLTPQSSPLASIQPTVDRSLLSRLVSVLTGQVPTAASPTDVGPSMGLDGGMTVGRDGPAGTPSGSGPGGFGDTDAGGYGSTKGIDPTGTR